MESTIQELRDELAQALADLEEASTLSEFNQTLVDILEELRARTEPKEQPAPQVNVTVAPADVTVIREARYLERIEHEYDEKGRIVRSVPIYAAGDKP